MDKYTEAVVLSRVYYFTEKKRKLKWLDQLEVIQNSKTLKSKEQMEAIQDYVELGVYPDSILIRITANERKNRKCDFRKTCNSFKVINGKLRKLKIARKYKDALNESRYCSE